MSPGSRRKGIAKLLKSLSCEGSPPQSGRSCSLLRGKVVLGNSKTQTSDTLPTPLIKIEDLEDSQHALWNMNVQREDNRVIPKPHSIQNGRHFVPPPRQGRHSIRRTHLRVSLRGPSQKQLSQHLLRRRAARPLLRSVLGCCHHALKDPGIC